MRLHSNFKELLLVATCLLLTITAQGQNNLIPDAAGCSAVKPDFDFKAAVEWQSDRTGIGQGNTPIVGDIDGDGKAEVFAVNSATSILYVFNGLDGTTAGSINFGVPVGGNYQNPMLICSIGGKGHVFVAGSDGNIYLYKVASVAGVRPITFTQVWKKPLTTYGSASSYGSAMPVVADFDGDGKLEFVAANYIIDSENGNVLATMNTRGMGPFTSFPLLADVDNNGYPEIIVGANVYKYSRVTGLQLWKTCPGFTNTSDGICMVGDVNADGNIDVAFLTTADRKVTVWTPATGATLGSFTLPTSGTQHWVSYPFIADIDGKEETNGRKYLEIVANTPHELAAYSYIGSGFSKKWGLAHSDNSGATSLTLFDFNNDGKVELVYRDQSVIRIFDGSGSTPVLTSPAITCTSGTLAEAPIVADIRGTGNAQIAASGSGRIMVVGGGASPWVSAPKVWNQQLYSPLLVNQDLTIPATVKSPLLEYTNCHNKTVQMYNGGPMQAPLVSETSFCIIDQSPDVYVISEGSSINVAGNQVTFTIKIGNKGSATATANTPIYFYRDIISTNAANKLGTMTLGQTIGVGETITVSKTFTVAATAINYYARLVDDGNTFPATGAFSDCDITNNTLQLVSEPPVGFDITSTLFSDDIWFFGKNVAGTEANGSCPGIEFKHSGGVATPVDRSGEARVFSDENSLSVSTPACDGNFVFYASHNYVYNSLHGRMVGGIDPSNDPGKIYGHNSVADGLAACYIGENKYMLVASSDTYDTSNPIGLYYYTIDMNGDNGQGVLSSHSVLENSGMSESMEIIPMPDKYDQYWLVYHHSGRAEMVVAKITPTGITKESSLPFSGGGLTFTLKRNAKNNRLAMSSNNKNLYLFHFDPFTGEIANDHTLATGLTYNCYGVEFSPNGSYIYTAAWNGNQILQYNLNTFEKKTGFYNGSTLSTNGGGGMKLGPDGRIYISIRPNGKYVGVIKTPDALLNMTNTNFYDPNGMELSVTYNSLALSTGLTPPAIDPPSSNNSPTPVADEAFGLNILPTTINPLVNDTDPDGNQLYLVSAEFTNPVDAAKGTIAVNIDGTTLTFTPNFMGHTFTEGEVIWITYRVRDNGMPVGLCADEQIKLTIKLAKLTLSLLNPSVDEGESVTVRVCMPDGAKAPTGGISVTLSRLASSTAAAPGDYTITPAGTATILEGQTCVDFTINATADDLLEGEEKFVLQATATNFVASNEAELIINDKTDGTIIVQQEGADPSEPGTNGAFRIKFKHAATKAAKRIKVEYSYTVEPTEGNSYTIPAGPVYIEVNSSYADVLVTITDNFVVEGAKKAALTITAAGFAD